MAKYGAGTIYQRGRVWWIAYWQRGRQRRESSRSRSKAVARALLNKRLHETADANPTEDLKLTLPELTALLVRHYEQSKLKSLPSLKSRLKWIHKYLGHLRARDVSTQTIEDYKDARLAADASIATVNRELDVIRRSFNLAKETERVSKAPRIRLLREDNVRTGFLEHEKYKTLKGSLPGYLRLAFVIAYHLGLRLGEIQRLCWDQIDLRGGVIYLWTGSTKNRSGRTAPIYGELAPELEMARAEIEQSFPDCPWVCHRNGKPLCAIYKDWRKACEAAAVPGLRPHDLRRTAVRNMLRAGISEKVVMQILGHKTRSMLDRYNIISERDLKEAGAKMDRWLESETVTKTVTVAAEKPN